MKNRYRAIFLLSWSIAIAAACGDRDRVPSDPSDPGNRSNMALVPAGAFIQGCQEEGDPDCVTPEQPARVVELPGFFIDKTEVTQRSYARCVDDGSCAVPECINGARVWDPEQNGDLPVVCVSWPQAQGYCAWLGKRLPSEAEWEKAARGDDGRVFPWGSDEGDCARANTRSCGGSVGPVGARKAGQSPYGALDMAGNVCEWVSDWYQSDYYATAPTSDPRGPTSGGERVVRDGSYLLDLAYSRSSKRHFMAPESAQPMVGFRCAMTDEGQTP